MNLKVNVQEQEQQVQLKQENPTQIIAEINKAPKFMAFNEHITDGYRLNFQHPFQILKSLFMFHNQTISIWTHLIGSLIVFSCIIWFFAVADKAQLQYQLKKYQNNLNSQFTQLNNIFYRIQNTLIQFESSKNSIQIKERFKKFQFQLEIEYKQATTSVKDQIKEIQKILMNPIQLTQQQIKTRKQISLLLSEFYKIQSQLQSHIHAILWQPFSDKIYQKTHQIRILRQNVQQIQTNINKKVIEYLELQKQTPNPYGIPRWPVLVFLFTATLCLGFSATFHLFYPMSSNSFKYFRRLDYAGIILNVVGTGIAPIFYSLYCNPFMGTVYLSVMIIFGSLLFVTLLGNWIHQEQNKKYKPIMFGLFGLTYLIPYSHFMLSQILFDNFGDSYKFSHSNFWWVTSSFSYLFGLYIFIKKWPQSKYKDKFNFIGSSHQIWHFICLCGVAATYIAININYQTRKSCPCP